MDSLQLPSGQNLSNQLGISGIPSLNAKQIYNEKWDDEEAIGAEEGEDWEDEVNRELANEEDDEGLIPVKTEAESPGALRPRQRRTRIVKRLVERPKTVYERFPAFEPGKVLDFTELFRGRVVKKPRNIRKAPLGEYHLSCCRKVADHVAVDTVNPRKKDVPKSYLRTVVGEAKRQVETKRVEEEVAAGSVEDDLAQTLEVRRSCTLTNVGMLLTELHCSICLRQMSLRRSLCMIVRLISYCCQTGRTKLYMNRIMIRNTDVPRLKRWLPPL